MNTLLKTLGLNMLAILFVLSAKSQTPSSASSPSSKDSLYYVHLPQNR